MKQRIHTVGKPYTCSNWGSLHYEDIAHCPSKNSYVKHKRIHTREHVDSVKVDYPSTKGHSLLDTRKLLQGENPINTMTVLMPSVISQTLLNRSGLLADSNVVTVGQPVVRCAPTADNRELVQERNLMNAVNLVMPSKVDSILFYVTKRHIGKNWYIQFGKDLISNIWLIVWLYVNRSI